MENLRRQLEEDTQKTYRHMDRGQPTMETYSNLTQNERDRVLKESAKKYSQKVYKKVKSSHYEDVKTTICQRENSFYVDTVHNFKTRRHIFTQRENSLVLLRARSFIFSSFKKL